MTVRISALCAQRLMAGATFPTQFNGGAIQLYSGTMPVSAELSPAGATLLGTVKSHTNGAPLYALDGNAALLDTSYIWRINLTATGFPSFVRILPNVSYPGSAIYTDQINLPLLTTSDQQVEISTFYVTLLTE